MDGIRDQGTHGFGNYLEHCGGFTWAMMEGPFGITFASAASASNSSNSSAPGPGPAPAADFVVATVAPNFPSNWSSASAWFVVRGTNVSVTYQGAASVGTVTLSAPKDASMQRLRFVSPDGTIDTEVTVPPEHSFRYAI